MPETHPFLIVDTCYWHHEWERCGICGVGDMPDNPEKPMHTQHDEVYDKGRMEMHPEHAAHLAMMAGRPVEWRAGEGWVVVDA